MYIKPGATPRDIKPRYPDNGIKCERRMEAINAGGKKGHCFIQCDDFPAPDLDSLLSTL